MGDLVFNRRQPFIDRPGGASIQGWITLLEQVAKAHGNDTIFVFGHAGDGFKVTGGKADLQTFRDFLTALLDVTPQGEGRRSDARGLPQDDDAGPRLHRFRPARRAGDRRGLGRTAVERPGEHIIMRVTVAAALAASISLAGVVAAQAPNQLSAADQKAGWTLLFDGTSLDGWRAYKRPDASRHALGRQGRPVVPRPRRQERHARRARHRLHQAVLAVRAGLGLARLGGRQQRPEVLRAGRSRRRDRPRVPAHRRREAPRRQDRPASPDRRPLRRPGRRQPAVEARRRVEHQPRRRHAATTSSTG